MVDAEGCFVGLVEYVFVKLFRFSVVMSQYAWNFQSLNDPTAIFNGKVSNSVVRCKLSDVSDVTSSAHLSTLQQSVPTEIPVRVSVEASNIPTLDIAVVAHRAA
jgi:hypothetical protein